MKAAHQSSAPSHKITTENPELADRFFRVLGETVEALQDTSLRYVFIGGIASHASGRPRSTHDIDLFVMPDDAELVLRALAKKGFNTERTDPSWLYKAYKENILVDVIFKSKGEIYLDPEMYQRSILADFHGKKLRLVAPEDLLIIKSAAHSELTPNHWHDATALLSHATMDWTYLIRRARRAPRRVLSLLLYAQSNDVFVPNHVIHDLYNEIFGDNTRGIAKPHSTSREDRVSPLRHDPQPQKQPRIPEPSIAPANPSSSHAKGQHAYRVGHLREFLAEDSRTNELDIIIEESGETILLRGEVSHSHRRDALEEIAREHFPDIKIENQVRVLTIQEPAGSEDVK